MPSVFGFGSLVDAARLRVFLGRDNLDVQVVTLRGYRRRWNVATDNLRTFSRYKYYIDPKTGERPPVFVTFLNIVPDPDSAITGVLFPVDDELLLKLDRRERNYQRVDVTEHIEQPVDDTVLTYIGLPEAITRFKQGYAQGQAVIRRDYYELVTAAFGAIGPDELQAFHATTDLPDKLPLRDLVRVDVRG